MKITLLAVTSLDGFITKGNNPNIYKWTSIEDQKFFFQQIEKAKLIFMGAKTYDIAKHLMKHKKGRIRIVFTRRPREYKKEVIPAILEFTNKNPEKVIKQFEKKGIHKALLVGGSKINTLFLRKKIITEMIITVEPVILGRGKTLFEEDLNVNLYLKSLKKINRNGTLICRYGIIPS